MANYIVTGPVVDLELHAASSDARHDAHLGVPMAFANGKVAMLVRANGAITRGHFCGVTGLAHDAQALTTSIVGTLPDAAPALRRITAVPTKASRSSNGLGISFPVIRATSDSMCSQMPGRICPGPIAPPHPA